MKTRRTAAPASSQRRASTSTSVQDKGNSVRKTKHTKTAAKSAAKSTAAKKLVRKDNPVADLSTLHHPEASICAICESCGSKVLSDGLYHAISEHHPECFDGMLHAMTKGGTEQNPQALNAPNRWGVPALAYACSYARMRCVKALISAGASIEGHKTNPLSWSCGHAGIAKYLISCGARVSDACQECVPGKTVLDRAREVRSRGKTYAAWADVIEAAA